MFLFSGTFFPLENLPPWARHVALVFPLTHLTAATRSLSLGPMEPSLFWNVGYLILFSLVFFRLALHQMNRRLIK
jgi:lipooligosaccharide transport system permease protein